MPFLRKVQFSVLVCAAALTFGLGMTGGEASAGQNKEVGVSDVVGTADLRDPCGYFPVGMYRHCDGGTGSTIMLDVRDFWGSIFHVCVGPGVSDLQFGIRWRVVDAWWNGGVGCIPGFYGEA